MISELLKINEVLIESNEKLARDLKKISNNFQKIAEVITDPEGDSWTKLQEHQLTNSFQKKLVREGTNEAWKSPTGMIVMAPPGAMPWDVIPYRGRRNTTSDYTDDNAEKPEETEGKERSSGLMGVFETITRTIRDSLK